MRTQDFIGKYMDVLDNKERWCSSVMYDGNNCFFSYGSHYPLLFKINGIWFVNDAGYSATTSKHISWAFSYADYSVQLQHTVGAPFFTLVKKALEEQIVNLTLEAAKKKRHDTQVFRDIERKWNNAKAALKAIEA
jgi:hypothetical protein